jgi:hypothetical protein
MGPAPARNKLNSKLRRAANILSVILAPKTHARASPYHGRAAKGGEFKIGLNGLRNSL